MENQKLVLVETLCVHYEIETSFFESLEEIGLIILVRQRDEIYVSEEKVAYLEKVLRLQKELNVNLEGIDVIFNLLEKVESLQSELSVAMQRLNYLNERI
jgi:hypothetical protein